MSKTKKIILTAAILIMTCAATAIASIAIYSNFAPIPQEKLFRGLVGKENLEDVETVKYNRNVTYLMKDGTEIDGDSESADYTWNQWN